MIVYGTAEWASVFEPNSMSGKYQVDICNLDKNTVKKLEDEGIPVKEGEVKSDGKDTTHKGSFITAKSTVAPMVVDSAKNIWPSTMKIGNGSRVKVSVTPFDWTFKSKSGVGASLNSVMVIDFVEMPTSRGEDLEEETEGYVLSSDPFDAEDDDDDNDNELDDKL